MDDGLDLVLLLSRRLPRLLGGPVIPGTFRHRLRLGRGRGFALASHEGIRWRVRVRGGLSRRGDDGVTFPIRTVCDICDPRSWDDRGRFESPANPMVATSQTPVEACLCLVGYIPV